MTLPDNFTTNLPTELQNQKEIAGENNKVPNYNRVTGWISL